MRRSSLLLVLALTGPALAEDRWVKGDLHEHVAPPDALVDRALRSYGNAIQSDLSGTQATPLRYGRLSPSKMFSPSSVWPPQVDV